jgi:hypothetical protein
MHLSDDYDRHICRKTFTKQNLDIDDYQFVINKNMSYTKYQMSYKGAAGKAFSAHMPISNRINCIFGLKLHPDEIYKQWGR